MLGCHLPGDRTSVLGSGGETTRPHAMRERADAGPSPAERSSGSGPSPADRSSGKGSSSARARAAGGSVSKRSEGNNISLRAPSKAPEPEAKYSIEKGHSIVPDQLEELDDRGKAQQLTELDARAFFRCVHLTSVELPYCCKILGRSSFSGCTGLTTIKLPEELNEIGVAAFNCCSRLTTIDWPAGLTVIGALAFQKCTSLKSIVLPKDVVEIDAGTFKDCTSLVSVVLPENCTTIRDGAFSGCIALTEVILPESVHTLGDHAFDGCTLLTNAVAKLPPNIKNVGGSAFGNCPNITAIRRNVLRIRIAFQSFALSAAVEVLTYPIVLSSACNRCAVPEGLESHNIRLLRPVHLPTNLMAKNPKYRRIAGGRGAFGRGGVADAKGDKKGKTARSAAEQAKEKAAAKAAAAAARRKAVENGEEVREDFEHPPAWKAWKLGPKPPTAFRELRESLKQFGRSHQTQQTWTCVRA